MNVVLVGFMASGKTAVGRRIANRLGYGFFDTDSYIESEVGCTIAEMFENKGEAYFRSLESRLARHLHKLSNHVISTGGGILTTEGNLEALRKAGLTVFLNADRGEILERLARDTRRPKLKEAELEETVNRLLGERMASYTQSDIVLNTKGKSVNRVAGEIIGALAQAVSPAPSSSAEQGETYPGEPAVTGTDEREAEARMDGDISPEAAAHEAAPAAAPASASPPSEAAPVPPGGDEPGE